NELVEALRTRQLLTLDQLNQIIREDLQGAFADARGLARELLKREWLTPYQVNQLLKGCGEDLVLGPYLLLQRLGEGGGGQVFKARHQQLQRDVALKIIRPELMTDPDMVARFYREIHLVGQLEHPNVVRAYDAGPIGTKHVLVMEYVEGT